jgi:hypothetical protein
MDSEVSDFDGFPEYLYIVFVRLVCLKGHRQRPILFGDCNKFPDLVGSTTYSQLGNLPATKLFVWPVASLWVLGKESHLGISKKQNQRGFGRSMVADVIGGCHIIRAFCFQRAFFN